MSSMVKGVNFRIGAVNAAGPAIAGFNRGLETMRRNAQQFQSVSHSWGAGLNRNRHVIQQFGYNMSDFAIQIAGGQSALLAFTQQGGQTLQIFGPFGAIMASLLAVFGALTIGITKSGVSFSELLPYFGVLEGALQSVVAGLSAVYSAMGATGQWIVANLDQVIITVGVAATYFGVMWVASMIAAAAATWSLSGALAFLRTALLRTGLGAIIVLAGYLIERFLTLVKGAGSFANALALLQAVAVEVFDRIVMAFDLVPAAIKFGAAKMSRWFVQELARMAYNFTEFVSGVANGLNSLFGTSLQPMGMGLYNQISSLEIGLGSAANAAYYEMAALNDSIMAPLQSLGPLMDALRAGDVTGDLPDWTGGGDEAGGAAAALVGSTKQVIDAFKAMKDSVSGSLESMFMSIVEKPRDFVDAIKAMVREVILELYRMVMVKSWVDKIMGFVGGIGGGLFGSPASGSLANATMTGTAFGKSFDGGGYTGSGPRSGGLDGKGGFMAMLHPRETVNDHTKGQNGGVTINQTINVSAGVVPTVRAEIMNMMPQIKRAAASGVEDANRRRAGG